MKPRLPLLFAAPTCAGAASAGERMAVTPPTPPPAPSTRMGQGK